MRRIPTIATSIAVGLLMFHSTGARRAPDSAERPHAPIAARDDSPQQGAPPSSQTDLSGTYSGVVTVVSTGETIPAVLKIERERFTLRLAGGEYRGAINVVGDPAHTTVEMTFDEGSPFGADWTCDLRLSRVGDRLALLAKPDARGGFSFHEGGGGGSGAGGSSSASMSGAGAGHSASSAGGGRDPASVTTNTSVANTNRVRHDASPSDAAGAAVDFDPGVRTGDSRNGNMRGSIPAVTPASDRTTGGRVVRAPGVGANARAAAAQPAATAAPAPQPTPMASAPPSHSEGVGAGTAADSPITHIVDNLPDGEMALDVPAKMQQGVPRIVTTRIAFKAIGDRLRDDLPQANPTESIKVAEVMKVVLTAKEKDDFLITDKSEATQVIVGKPYAEWSWEVTPLKSGKHALHLNASAMLRDEGQRTPFVVPTKDKDIEVQVSYKFVAGQLINKYWSLLFGGVSLVGVLTGARKAYAQWKGRGGTAQPTS